MERMRAADLLIEKIKRDCRESVAVVVVMGSTLYDETHARSDLDMYFVVKDAKGEELGMTFIIDGIGFDFWPITWERMERIASHEERITAILTEGRVLYHGSADDLARFQALKAKALDVRDGGAFMAKARRVFDGAYKHHFLLGEARNPSEARKHGIRFLFALTHALALLNRDTVKRGRGKLKGELLAMPLVPTDFERHYDVFFESMEVSALQKAATALLRNMEALLRAQEAAWRAPVEAREALQGFYEELINFYNKIQHGVETGDRVTALYAAHEIMEEVDDVLQGTGLSAEDLPDLREAYDPEDVSAFLRCAKDHQKAFEGLLKAQGVPLRIFSDMEELERFLLGDTAAAPSIRKG